MDMDCYKMLARHLDSLPGGFPPSESGVELSLLRRLFTLEEAELAVHLTLEREEAHVIADRAGIDALEAEQRLNKMARKGLIFSIEPEDGQPLYHAVPWIVGIYEFQVNRLDKDFVRDFNEYAPIRGKDPRQQKIIPQIRTIPVGRSIEPRLEVLPYERADELLKAQEKFAVAPCICRSRTEIMGARCDAPMEGCLMFGDWAHYYVRNGLARYIDSTEVMDILARADEANLVLQPSNSRDASFLCNCCGCCCGILTRLKHHPRPSEAVSSPFIAKAEPETCEGCGTCAERCQMDAVMLENEKVFLDATRCIGCGLCVSTCPSGSLTLARKPSSQQQKVPINMDATWREIDLIWSKLG